MNNSIISPLNIFPKARDVIGRWRNWRTNDNGPREIDLTPAEFSKCEELSWSNSFNVIQGTIGEYVVGLWLLCNANSDRPLWCSQRQRGPDGGKDLFFNGFYHQVKTTDYLHGKLVANTMSQFSQVYWLVIRKDMNTFQIAGWIWADTYKYLADDYPIIGVRQEYLEDARSFDPDQREESVRAWFWYMGMCCRKPDTSPPLEIRPSIEYFPHDWRLAITKWVRLIKPFSVPNFASYGGWSFPASFIETGVICHKCGDWQLQKSDICWGCLDIETS